MELINLGCGHKPDELFSFQEPGVFTDPENGESCCRRCSDNRPQKIPMAGDVR
ncbi:hypothetical protein ACWD25_13365 [Streptomyces sp. NPDC002920]